MKIAELQEATKLIGRKDELEELKMRTLAKEPSFLEAGRPAPIGLRELNDKEREKLQAAMKETVMEFFDEMISGIMDRLEALGVETGRPK